MPSLSQLTSYGQIAAVLLGFLALARAISISRKSPYRELAIFLAIQLTGELTLLSLRYGTKTYGNVYVAIAVPLTFARFFYVLAVYRIILERYPGIRRISFWAIQVCFALSILSGVIFTLSEPTAPKLLRQLLLVMLYRVELVVVTTLFLFVLLINVFLAYYPIRLSRNTVVHTVAFALLLFFEGLGFYHLLFRFSNNAAILAIMQWGSCAALTVWALGLTRRGELSVSPSRRTNDPAAESRLLEQLVALEKLIGSSSGSNSENGEQLRSELDPASKRPPTL